MIHERSFLPWQSWEIISPPYFIHTKIYDNAKTIYPCHIGCRSAHKWPDREIGLLSYLILGVHEQSFFDKRGGGNKLSTILYIDWIQKAPFCHDSNHLIILFRDLSEIITVGEKQFGHLPAPAWCISFHKMLKTYIISHIPDKNSKRE